MAATAIGVFALLVAEGWRVSVKRVYRIWRREGLKVPKKQPKRGRLWLNDGSCIRLRPERPNHVWSYDFVQDQTEDKRSFRMLAVIDEHTRRCLAIVVAASQIRRRAPLPDRSHDRAWPTGAHPFKQRPTLGISPQKRATDLHSLTEVSACTSTSSRRLPPSRKKLSSIANTGSSTRYIGPHRPQHEMQFQAEDPSIIYRVADAPSRLLLREVLPPGTGPSTKGR